MNPDDLDRVRAALDAFAREFPQSFSFPGDEVASHGLPGQVLAARAFYEGYLTPEDDTFGHVTVRRLAAELGSALVVFGDRTESQWGAFEVYSPAGQLVAAGVHVAGAAAWLEQAQVRAAMEAIGPPVALMPRPATLEWLSQGPQAWQSIGGRFFISPPGMGGHPPTFQMSDALTGAEHLCASGEAAQALAATIHAQG